MLRTTFCGLRRVVIFPWQRDLARLTQELKLLWDTDGLGLTRDRSEIIVEAREWRGAGFPNNFRHSD